MKATTLFNISWGVAYILWIAGASPKYVIPIALVQFLCIAAIAMAETQEREEKEKAEILEGLNSQVEYGDTVLHTRGSGLYYIMHTKKLGETVRFYRPGMAGLTQDLSQAGQFSEKDAQILSRDQEDAMPIRCDIAELAGFLAVDAEHLYHNT